MQEDFNQVFFFLKCVLAPVLGRATTSSAGGDGVKTGQAASLDDRLLVFRGGIAKTLRENTDACDDLRRAFCSAASSSVS